MLRVAATAAVLAGCVVAATTVPASCSATRTCTAAINAAIAACAGAPCTISLEAGAYVLDGAEYGARILIDNANGLTLAGAGDATVLIANISTLFSVSNSARVTFAGFAVDMERLPFTYGQVVAATPSSSTVSFDATSTYRVDLARYAWLNRAQAIISYDPVKQRIAKGTDIYATDDPIPITYTAGGAAATLTVPVALRVGDFVIIRHQVYGYNAFTVERSSALAWRNVTLWAVAGMGIYTDETSGIDIEALRIERTGGRPMSITADGVHFSNSRGGAIALRHCLFEGQGDDGLNAPTIFQFLVAAAADGRSFQVGGRGVAGPQPPLLGAGDTAQFFDRATLLPLGTAAVVGVGENFTVLLAAPGVPAGVGVYALVNDAQEYAASLEVTDSVFRNNRARGALLKSSNVFVARNIFEGMSASAVKTETDGCYWQEGHPVTNWSFVDNAIIEANVWGGLADVVIDNAVPVFANGVPTTTCVPYAAAAPGAAVQRGLNISGNTFSQVSGESAIGVYSTDGVEVRGNVIATAAGARAPAVDIAGHGVVGAVVAGNTCDGGACVVAGMGA
jgi:hypothetical protein